MSLEARLKQGLPRLADPIVVNHELDYVRVAAIARQRERRNVILAALAGAAAAAFLLVAGPRMAELILSVDIQRPVPPAEREFEDDRSIDDAIPEKLDQADLDRHDRVARTRVAQLTGVFPRISFKEAGTKPTGGGSGNPIRDVPHGGGDPESATPDIPPAREATGEYTGSALPVGGGTSTCEQAADGGACVRLETEPGERSVDISIVDEGGGSVFAAVQIDRDADGRSDGEWTYICSETVRPLAIPSDGVAVVYVEIYRGTCQDGSGAQSNPVRGKVTAVFGI